MDFVMCVHPLSVKRGMLIPYLNFLTNVECSVIRIKEIVVCTTTASLLKWTYTDDGWPRALPTVVCVFRSSYRPDDLIGAFEPRLCHPDTLKGHFFNQGCPKHDSLVFYTKTDKELVFYKNLFSL